MLLRININSLKKLLILFLLIHITCILFVNIISFKRFTDQETEKINFLGKLFLKQIKINSFPKIIENSVGFYTNLTGTNRGYEFFSPNVAKSKVKLLFVNSDNKEINILKQLPESQVKLLTATYYFNSYLLNKSFRDKLLSSIGARVFSIQPHTKEIIVFLKVAEFDNLREANVINYKIKTDTIFLSKIRRNEN